MQLYNILNLLIVREYSPTRQVAMATLPRSQWAGALRQPVLWRPLVLQSGVTGQRWRSSAGSASATNVLLMTALGEENQLDSFNLTVLQKKNRLCLFVCMIGVVMAAPNSCYLKIISWGEKDPLWVLWSVLYAILSPSIANHVSCAWFRAPITMCC